MGEWKQETKIGGLVLNIREDEVKDVKPSKIEIIRATNENKTAYVVVTQKHTESMNCKVMMVEMHPVLIIKQLTTLSIPEAFKGTDYYDGLYNRFYLALNEKENRAVFGPRDSIAIRQNFQSFGIGSYMFSQLIKWGAPNFPNLNVRRGSLSASDAERDDGKNKERRNSFYENFGFTLEPPNPDDGKFGVVNLGSLHEHVNCNKINILPDQVQPTDMYPFFDISEVAKLVTLITTAARTAR